MCDMCDMCDEVMRWFVSQELGLGATSGAAGGSLPYACAPFRFELPKNGLSTLTGEVALEA
ncbi:hypothetical protein AYO47_03785 [Planctomyces sp. SCGC AG-212-M04]|nr:hypothetical protein AYO47_03785 [Planctomyces sp. SCGC AG-212-M04]